MKFLGLHMADALLLAIALTMGIGAIVAFSTISRLNTAFEIFMTSGGAILLAGIALVIAYRVLTNPLSTKRVKPVPEYLYRPSQDRSRG